MHNLEKADEIFSKMSTDDKVNKFYTVFRDTMPEAYCHLMYVMEYGCHIATEDMYNKAVELLEWANGKSKGANWTVSKILDIADIDFTEVPYFEYDLAYVVNMLYSDYCTVFTDTDYYIKMAKAYLTDPDYMGKSDERAYHNAIKRIKYFNE